MTLKRVKKYDLFATGDACIYSMAGEPQYMHADITPSKHYTGYIKSVDNMHHEYKIVITNDKGQLVTLTHHADPVRTPIGLPLYYMMEVLLDEATYKERLRSREKKDLKYAEKRFNEAKDLAAMARAKGEEEFDALESY